MSVSMYRLTVPSLLRGFFVLGNYIQRAEVHAATNNIDPTSLIQARLAPDMLTFAGQIQRASDKSKNGVARLTGVEAPRFEDNEVSFKDLEARIAKTVRFLKSIDENSFEGSDTRAVEFNARSIGGKFSGADYLIDILLPDFFFHVTTAHDILRHHEVSVGKADYLARLT
jgi:hypothetical protein